jgi:hypothetical protein
MAAWPFRRGKRPTERRVLGATKNSVIVYHNAQSAEMSASKAAAGGGAHAPYACHYCERADGVPTRDHKHPKMYGGTGRAGNIVWCCQMCNSIKAARLYEWFVPFFQQFLELHAEEYRAANPDDWSTIGAITRKFNAWLHGMNHAEGITASS